MLQNYEQNLKTFFNELDEKLKKEEFIFSNIYQKELKDFFEDLTFRRVLYEQFKEQADNYLSSDFNVFDTINPDENRLSDIIANIIDKNGTHGQGSIFIDTFIEYFIKKRLNISKGGYKVYREYFANGRIDIYLESDTFAIIIENKPFTLDQKDQLKRYYYEIEKRHKDNLAIIYLNKNKSEPSAFSIDERTLQRLKDNNMFLTLSYYDFKDNVLKTCYQKCESDKFRFFLKDFMDYIEKNPYFKDFDKED